MTVTVTAWAGPAFVRRAVREDRGPIYSAPEVLEITNRHNENDGVSKRVHELAFGWRARARAGERVLELAFAAIGAPERAVGTRP